MNNSANTFGNSKKKLAMCLYKSLIDEDAIDLEEYGAECFIERFEEVLQDYGLFLKSTMIEQTETEAGGMVVI